jgi:hypothetical protein
MCKPMMKYHDAVLSSGAEDRCQSIRDECGDYVAYEAETVFWAGHATRRR